MRIVLFLFFLLVGSGMASAAEYFKDGATIEQISQTASRPANSAYSNHVYIKVSTEPNWSNGECSENWIALQENDDKGFSIALAAFASGHNVHIRVDDSLPKIGGTHCQVTTITIKK